MTNKVDLINTKGIADVQLLKKSKFYMIDDNLREHIANYKGYAVLLKQENLRKEIDDEKQELFPSIVKVEDLKHLKRVNSGIIKKIKPDTLYDHEKMFLLNKIQKNIDEMIS